MDQYNDISFEIGGKLVVLIEHQSSINENIALRLLMYIGRVYEKIVEGKNIYARKPVKIPVPEFFVLYNGTDSFPDQKIYKLSDSFEKLKSLNLLENDSPSLELTVRVININEGRNQDMVDRCKELLEYSVFVAKARFYINELGNREEGIKKAIIYCEKHGILREFLKAHASEVLNMLFTEFNLDDAIAVAKKEGHEEGREEGLEKGLEKGHFNAKLEIARNLLVEGSTAEFVQKITGLDMETIENL